MKTTHTVISGDSRKMAELADRSIDLVITSPPYWQLKDYGPKEQIGFHHTYQDYINHLGLVWQECVRVLDAGCRLCIDIGDQFARSVYYGRYKVIPIRTEIIKCCQALGLDYLGAVIWQKVSTTHTSGGATIMGSFPFPRNGILKLDYEFILVFRKPGKPGKKIDPDLKEQSRLTIDQWNTYFSGHWRFPGVRQEGHLAMFPLELPLRLIKMFSFVGDTVLDPFLGSGTTSLAALQLRRHSVGYEINTDFLPIIKKKLGTDAGKPGDQAEYREIGQASAPSDFDREIAGLPYIFHDPQRLDKKVDPVSDSFGSRIDATSPQTQMYYSVREVVSPEVLILQDGQEIRLLGIKTRKDRDEAAVAYLKKKLKGQKVFLRFDGAGQEEENRRLCYMYLKNKTFINAHLVKENLVDVDVDRDFKCKSRFLAYRQKALG